jgi:hypothetical protein
MNIPTLVSEKKILNETKNHNLPLQVKWSVSKGKFGLKLISKILTLFCLWRMGHKSVNPVFFFLEKLAVCGVHKGGIIFYWCILRLFLQLTCQNITHLSMSSHRAFMIYKYTYHRCEKKTLLKTPFTNKTYKHR